MNNLNIIVAKGKNNEIGRNNSLIWSLPDDLKFFKEKTNNKIIVMGYNTFKSLPKMLPNRKHIILTHKNIKIDNALIFNDKNILLDYIKNINEEVFIIGGASIYNLFINDVDTMYITEIDEQFDADVFFPNFNKSLWDKALIGKGINNNLKFKHFKYSRKK